MLDDEWTLLVGRLLSMSIPPYEGQLLLGYHKSSPWRQVKENQQRCLEMKGIKLDLDRYHVRRQGLKVET